MSTPNCGGSHHVAARWRHAELQQQQQQHAGRSLAFREHLFNQRVCGSAGRLAADVLALLKLFPHILTITLHNVGKELQEEVPIPQEQLCQQLIAGKTFNSRSSTVNQHEIAVCALPVHVASEPLRFLSSGGLTNPDQPST